LVQEAYGAMLKNMIIGAATLLEKNKETLNAMNVFPVPDGDTGTNMSLTMISAAKEVSSVQGDDARGIIEALSLGALKGARGNSGVILSQIFSGFGKAANGEELPASGTEFMAKAFSGGVEAAYKAVMKPKEGTILTVATSMADAAQAMAEKTTSVSEQLAYMIKQGEETLKETPEMLPVLKEAGVVDAGGAGLVMIVIAFKAVLDGEDVGVEEIDIETLLKDDQSKAASADNADIEFGYCTEFFIKNLYPHIQTRDLDTYRQNLSKIGDSLIVVGDLNLVKTHVHTNEPGLALQYAQILGELSQIKIDNMREQHRELADELPPEYLAQVQPKKDLVVVTVTSGEGIRSVFADWQVDQCVEGGQSMNPSTDDILRAIENAPSDNVIVLPNNKNIVLAAEQAAGMSEKNVVVVGSRSIPQGIAAAVAYDPDADLDTNVNKMKSAITGVKTGLITSAVRDSKINGTEIKEGDVIGLLEDTIVANGTEKTKVMESLLSQMLDDTVEMVSLYYGEGVHEGDAQQMSGLVEEKCKQCDVEMLYGGQPVYEYIISME